MRIGTQVKFTRRNNDRVTGRVATAIEKKANGEWLGVNIGDKKKPNIVNVRPSMLTRV